VSGRYEFLNALENLVKHRVRFVVIGGIAGNLLGSTTVTHDLDVCYARSEDNLVRMVAALKEVHARLRGAPEDVPFILEAKTLKFGDHFTFVTDLGSLDILGHPSGIPGGYDELERAADEIDLGEFRVKVASIDDLIRMKRAVGRPKDLIEVEVLGALRDEIDAQAAEKRRARRQAKRGGSSRRTAGSG
jgi:HAMP domain-containing protein